MIAVTVCADPGEGTNPGTPQRRLDKLEDRVGSDRLPPGLKAGDLSKWGLADVCRQIIHNTINKTLNDRNGPITQEERLFYWQLFNFQYSDGTRMCTVGGLLLNREDEAKFGKDTLQDLDFVRSNDKAYLIEIPVLTWRETIFLDKVLLDSNQIETEFDWLPQEDRDKYERIWRYSPTYIEAEL